MKKFKPGQAIVFEPNWYKGEKVKGKEVYPKNPMKWGDIVLYLAPITPATGHCIITTYEGKITAMVHDVDFRAATEDEV